tara:strand:+ start:12860 stop:15172 length:2313 start_codon:yes stop_codon:yes gene_type:complete
MNKLFIALLAFALNISSQQVDLSNLNLTKENLALFESLPDNVKQRIYQEYTQLGLQQQDIAPPRNVVQETTLVKTSQANNVSKFGYDFFDSIPTTSTPITDVPIPNEYILGAGDILEIFLKGDTNQSFRLSVSRKGSINFPQIGEIFIDGLSLADAKEKINLLISEVYLSTEAIINIAETKFIQVYVLGAVKNPGSFLVNPFTTVSNMIALAGGIRNYGSLRNIKLRGKSGEKNYDLYDLLIMGERTDDFTLRSGDTIFVPSSDKFVEISGAVNRPSIYEISEKDTLEDLIRFSQGFMPYANQENLQITFIDNDKLNTENFSLKDKPVIKNAQKIFVSAKNPYFEKDVFINGAVIRPGPVEINGETSLVSLLDNVALSEDVYPFFSLIKSYNPKKYSYELKSFSITDIGSYEDIMVYPGSEIFILSNKDVELRNRGTLFFLDPQLTPFIDLHNVSVSGLFKKTGNFPVFGSYPLSSLVDYVGGILPTAEKPRIEFITPFNNLSLINPDLDEVFNDEYLGSYLFVNGKNSEIVNVSIEGEVKNPGTYAMLPGSTLQDLYKKAGGLKSSASTKSIALTRESIRLREQRAINVARENLIKGLVDNIANVASQNVNAVNGELISLLTLAYSVSPSGRLAGDLAPDTDVANDLVLNNGDVVKVFTKPQTISIAGEVNSPLTVYFDKKYSFKDYLKLAGGYTDSSDKGRIYIIKSDGTALTPDQSLFAYGYVPEPGDTIIVPKKLLQLSGLPLVESATSILSSIAFSAASLNALNN